MSSAIIENIFIFSRYFYQDQGMGSLSSLSQSWLRLFLVVKPSTKLTGKKMCFSFIIGFSSLSRANLTAISAIALIGWAIVETGSR